MSTLLDPQAWLACQHAELSAGATKLCPGIDFLSALRHLGGAGLCTPVYSPSIFPHYIFLHELCRLGSTAVAHLFIISTSLLHRAGWVTNQDRPSKCREQSQFARTVCFLITFYFENVNRNRKAKNLHLGSQLLPFCHVCFIFYLTLFQMVLLNHMKVSYRQHDGSPLKR